MEFLSLKVLQALEFASWAHREQVRKFPTTVPYISHPAAVALILFKAGFAEEVVVAGILHDTIEDTSVTFRDIEQKFGLKVAELVQGVTEQKDLPWQERKEAYLKHLENASVEIDAISGADLLANLSSLLLGFKAGVNTWESFSKNPEEYARKTLEFHRRRIEMIKQKSGIPFASELEQVSKEVEKNTKDLYGF